MDNIQLEHYVDYICVNDGEKPNITISKKALAKWCKQYGDTAKIIQNQGLKMFYIGKWEVLNDLIAHIEKQQG